MSFPNLRLSSQRLLDGTGAAPLQHAAILIAGGRIAALGPAASVPSPEGCRTVDLGDVTLMPGMIDAHLHTFGLPSTGLHALGTEREAYRALRAAGELKQLLYAGFTSARCLGSSVGPDLRRAIQEGHIEGPRLVAAGEFISSTGGTWDEGGLPLPWARQTGALADGPEGLRDVVRQRLRSGADFIKLGLSKGLPRDRNHAWGDDPAWQTPGFSLEEVRAAVAEAHAHGMKVSAHAIGEDAVRLALDGGIDVIEHGYAITPETRRRLVDSGTIVVTTIAQLHFHRLAYEPFHYSTEDRAIFERHWDAMQESFALGLAAGVRFALGTDLVGAPTHPLAEAAKEFELAVAWGMSSTKAIQAGTQTAAEVLGIAADTGTLTVGKRADIIAVPGDPLSRIEALQSVDLVVRDGRVVRTSRFDQAF